MKRIVLPRESKEDVFNYEDISKDTIIGILSKINGVFSKSVLIKTETGFTGFSADLDISEHWFAETKSEFILKAEKLEGFINAFVFTTGQDALLWLSERYQ